MTKPQAKKLIIPISVGLAVILIGIVSILLIGGKNPPPKDTPSTIPADTSSELASSKPTVSVPDIEVTATSSKTLSSAPVSEITVDGSPSSKLTSSKPNSPTSSVSSKAQNKPTSSTPTKPKPTSSQPPKVESKAPSTDPNNPSNGTIKIETNKYGDEREMEFWDGQWWDNGPANDKTVDDSDKVSPPCDVCGNPPKECICPPIGH